MSTESKHFFEPNLNPPSPESNLAATFLKAIGWTLAFLGVFVIITILSIGVFAYRKLHVVALNSGVTERELIQTVRDGWNTPLSFETKNILVLGKDELPTRGNSPVLTDTIMIASINAGSGSVRLFSLPRDLWLDDYKTKINALYFYGKTKTPERPESFPEQVLSQTLSLPITPTLVLDLQEVAQLIDLMGGLQIEIPTAFTDTEFPRTDVDVTKEHDPTKLYQTVTFAAGPQTLSGEKVLQYIRSRHSGDTQGTDIARAERQQLVIKSLINQLKHPNFYFTHLAESGQLYRFYLDHFADILSPTEVVALGKQMMLNGAPFSFQAATPSIFPDSPTGVITHPQNLKPYQNQWVYVVKDLPGLQKEVAIALGFLDAPATSSAEVPPSPSPLLKNVQK